MFLLVLKLWKCKSHTSVQVQLYCIHHLFHWKGKFILKGLLYCNTLSTVNTDLNIFEYTWMWRLTTSAGALRVYSDWGKYPMSLMWSRILVKRGGEGRLPSGLDVFIKVPNHINITCERHNLFVTFMHSFGMWHSQLNFFGKLGRFFFQWDQLQIVLN